MPMNHTLAKYQVARLLDILLPYLASATLTTLLLMNRFDLFVSPTRGSICLKSFWRAKLDGGGSCGTTAGETTDALCGIDTIIASRYIQQTINHSVCFPD